jgi:hypothetical protein
MRELCGIRSLRFDLMRRLWILSITVLAVLIVAACGSESPPAASPPTTNALKLSSPSYEKAKPYPSTSAKMVCEAEVRGDIAKSLGAPATKVTTPTWKDHLYSCTYVYPNGSFVLSVKELSSEKQTTDFFNRQKQKLGFKDELNGLGQGGFAAKNDDVVVRKDYKVLTVDVTKAPKAVGALAPNMTRSDIAASVAAVIMTCWPDE